MSDQATELQEVDSEEQAVFPPEERRIVTQAYDLSVQTLKEQWDSRVLIIPEIQREYIWDNGRSSRLIESLLLNIPIPVLYFSETPEAVYEVIDGHQRIRSIVRFINNEFALSGISVLTEYRGLRFHELPTREQRFIRMRTLRAIIIAHESHPTMKFEIFERLNSGSISLNAQELRNSIYRGPFNRLLKDLIHQEVFRNLIGSKTPRRRMVDEELLLRFFALSENLHEYRTPLKRFLNNYMASKRNIGDAEAQEFTGKFARTVERLSRFLNGSAFRMLDDRGRPVEKTVNRALFDSQMMAFSWVEDEQNAAPRRVVEELVHLFQSEDFLDSVQRATGDRSRTFRRISSTVAALRAAGLTVNQPFPLEV